MSTFQLHPTLAKDSVLVAHSAISQLRMINNHLVPWFIVVPDTVVTDLHQLEPDFFKQIMNQVQVLAKKFQSLFNADKVNIASIGNLVDQLHIHLVCRQHTDPVWPGVIWGAAGGEAYSDSEQLKRITKVKTILPDEFLKH